VTLYGDRKISLFGADNADNLRGQYFDGIVIDEPGNMRPSVFTEIIRPALSDRRGWAVFIGTPNGKNEFYEFNERARASLGGPDGWYYLNLKASESGSIPQSELDDARTIMSEDEYAQEFENDFGAAIKGAYYGKDMNVAEGAGRIGSVPYLPGVQVQTAWDLGYTDDTAIWFFQVVKKAPRFFDAWSTSGQSIDQIIAHLHVMRDQYGLQFGQYYLPHDAKAKSLQTGKSIVEQLIKHGIRGRIVPDLSVQDGIQAVRKMLAVASFDAVRCGGKKGALEAMRQYQREWDEVKQVFRQKPLHDWTSHYADAMRMAALGYSEDYSAPEVYIPESRRAKPLISDGVQLEKLWGTVDRPVGRWRVRI